LSSPDMTNQPADQPPTIEPNPPASAESNQSPIQSAPPAGGPSSNGSTEQRIAPPVRTPYISREERERRRREALSSLTVGEWREGKVTGIAAFGAFVDLGGVDGLVHVSQLGTGGYVERVEDVVQVNQVVRVRVAEVDTERGRVSLSMREPRAAAAPRERPAQVTPRPARPAPLGGPAPAWNGGGGGEPAPESRPDRRFRGRPERGYGKSEDRPARRAERTRRGRDSDDEDWRTVRGDPRNFYSFADEVEEEPAPTTAEELVARFGRRDTAR